MQIIRWALYVKCFQSCFVSKSSRRKQVSTERSLGKGKLSILCWRDLDFGVWEQICFRRLNAECVKTNLQVNTIKVWRCTIFIFIRSYACMPEKHLEIFRPLFRSFFFLSRKKNSRIINRLFINHTLSDYRRLKLGRKGWIAAYSTQATPALPSRCTKNSKFKAVYWI